LITRRDCTSDTAWNSLSPTVILRQRGQQRFVEELSCGAMASKTVVRLEGGMWP